MIVKKEEPSMTDLPKIPMTVPEESMTPFKGKLTHKHKREIG
jgi:hypothetical protein